VPHPHLISDPLYRWYVAETASLVEAYVFQLSAFSGDRYWYGEDGCAGVAALGMLGRVGMEEEVSGRSRSC
jgi:hypothetical protein